MKIEEVRSWCRESIRRACIRNHLYTGGAYEEYEDMLRSAASLEPTVDNIYTVAKDILEHSEDQTLSNVMYILANDAMHIHYEIEEG